MLACFLRRGGRQTTKSQTAVAAPDTLATTDGDRALVASDRLAPTAIHPKDAPSAFVHLGGAGQVVALESDQDRESRTSPQFGTWEMNPALLLSPLFRPPSLTRMATHEQRGGRRRPGEGRRGERRRFGGGTRRCLESVSATFDNTAAAAAQWR